jgi:hypothetical protein
LQKKIVYKSEGEIIEEIDVLEGYVVVYLRQVNHPKLRAVNLATGTIK